MGSNLLCCIVILYTEDLFWLAVFIVTTYTEAKLKLERGKQKIKDGVIHAKHDSYYM